MSKKNKKEEQKAQHKVTGMRTAVKTGDMTPKEAIRKLEKFKQKGKFVGDKIMSWLRKKQQQKT